MKKKLLAMLLVSVAMTPVIANDEFADYKRQQEKIKQDYVSGQVQAFEQYKKELNAGFDDFKQTYLEESRKYREQITERWGSYKESGPKVWVNYAQNGKIRESVNFETGVVEVEVLADKTDSMAEIKQQARQAVSTLLSTTEKQAFENDVVAQKVEEKLQQHTTVVKTGKPSATRQVMLPLVSAVSQADKEAIANLADAFIASVSTEVIEQAVPAEKKIVKLTFKIPENLSAKADKYSTRVQQIAERENIPVSLVFAVIETESNFNPLAKSHVPAYGLMQIVPVSAGKDASKYLFGKEKVLSPSYLYNSDNNIAIGGAYLHILYHRYLSKINDSTSRLFCTIAAYNTGAGNVARSFIGIANVSKATSKINSMSASEVYQHLRKNLPHDE
ncbi:MAG: DUF3393 domain-containing protein, partial [Methyloprofundus sp.]|nr:DUF3393 domain-containing protein [Methyloprofundus sp.]